MGWNTAVLALVTISVISIFAGLLGGRTREYRGLLLDYLLADQTLGRQSVVQLLFSGSFSLNGMLYQVWLGYAIGLWALVVQGAWAISYVLLSPYSEQLLEAKSLHSFLGERFGQRTRVIAGICSIVGFTVLVGWEFNVGFSTFEGLFNLHTEPGISRNAVFVFMLATVFASFLYTAIGGLRSDAFANFVQNVIKLLVFTGIIGVLYAAMKRLPFDTSLKASFFPPFSQVVSNLGWFGLITNLAFSLVWQFVDMSTWQSVIASRPDAGAKSAKSALKWGGIAVFIAPGIIGTLLGVTLVGVSGVDANNVMTKLVAISPNQSPMLMFFFFSALIAAMMSMIDGVLLAAAYSAVCDVIYRNKTLEQIDSDEDFARKLLLWIRLFLGIVAFTGTIGVFLLVTKLQISLFDIVYVLIVGQLSLAGPVLVGLQGKTALGDRMWWAILTGIGFGVGAFVGNRLLHWEWLLTGAGFFTILASWAVAIGITTRRVKTVVV